MPQPDVIVVGTQAPIQHRLENASAVFDATGFTLSLDIKDSGGNAVSLDVSWANAALSLAQIDDPSTLTVAGSPYTARWVVVDGNGDIQYYPGNRWEPWEIHVVPVHPEPTSTVPAAEDLFLQSGSGAVGRTFLEKVREWISPQDFDGDYGDSITVTVGSGGDFQTIGAALAYMARTQPQYVAAEGGSPRIVSLLSGFVQSEQVIIDGIDLSRVTITSEDAVVSVARSALTTALPAGTDRFPAWLIDNEAKGPKIGVLFRMDTSGDATNRYGIRVWNGSSCRFSPGAGFQDAPGRNLEVARGGRIPAGDPSTGCLFGKSAGSAVTPAIGVRVSNGSRAYLRKLVAEDCAVNVAVGNGCEANLNASSLKGGTSSAIHVTGVAMVGANEADTSNSAKGIEALDSACEINFINGIANNCTLRAFDLASGAKVSASGVTATGAGNFAVAATGAGTSFDAPGGNFGAGIVLAQHKAKVNLDGAIAGEARVLNGGEIDIADESIPTNQIPGVVTPNGLINASSYVETGITASTTQTQAGGYALTRRLNYVSTVANANDALTAMLIKVAGERFTVVNAGANALQLFPGVGDNLGAGLNTAIPIPAGESRTFEAINLTIWARV